LVKVAASASGDDTAQVAGPAYERLARASELFMTKDGPGDRHAIVVVRLAGEDPAARGPLTVEALAAQVASRLHLVPARFRRVLRRTPLRLAGPTLVDDAHFDLSRHVHALPAEGPVSEAGLVELIDAYAREPLDPRRPLWEIAVTPELEEGGRAILLKMHHGLVEGEGGVANAALLVFDASPDPDPPPPPQPWHPAPAPNRFEAIRFAIRDQLSRLAFLAHAPSAARMSAAARRQWDAFGTYRREIVGRQPQPRYRPPMGPRHETAFAVSSTGQVEAIRAAAGDGVTFNDALVTAVAGGLRRWQAEVGLEEGDLTAAVPVNLSRKDGEVPPVLTEMPSFMLVRLPATEARADDRLRLVRTAAARGKELAPKFAVVAAAFAQLPTSLYRRLADHLYDSTQDFYLANIQGPDMELYVLGHPVEFAYITGRTRRPLRVAGLSFAGSVTLGIACDPDRVPEPRILARCIEEEIDALASSAASATPGPAQRSSS
jgi:diacylglycerol O-acyltransferase / wax synthase